LSFLGEVGVLYAAVRDITEIFNAPPDQQAGLAAEKAGGWAGAIELGEVGAEMGSAFGPIGTVIGGAIGGTIGYVGGEAIVKELINFVHTFSLPDATSALKALGPVETI
jgi:phage tail tape-measure protein